VAPFASNQPRGKNHGKTGQKNQRIFEAAIAFLRAAHFARLGAKMRLPEEKHVIQNPPSVRPSADSTSQPVPASVKKTRLPAEFWSRISAGQWQFQVPDACSNWRLIRVNRKRPGAPALLRPSERQIRRK